MASSSSDPIFALLAVVLLAGCASTKVSETAPPGVDLSGTWQLNKEKSADTQGAIAYALSQQRNSGGRGDARSGGMRGGKGGGSRGGGGRRGGGEKTSGQSRVPGERLETIVAELSPSTEQVTIEQTTSELTVIYGNQWDYRHRFGQEHDVSVMGYDGEQISGWQEHQYVVETKTESDSKVTERFTVSSDGSRLQIQLTIESKRLSDPIIVTRVFDKSTPSTT